MKPQPPNPLHLGRSERGISLIIALMSTLLLTALGLGLVMITMTEAMISAYQLGVHHGEGDPDIRDQIREALHYTLGQQIRPESAFNVVGEGLGGMPGSPIDRTVRIDYVQHVCSAMIRASEWIDGPAR